VGIMELAPPKAKYLIFDPDRHGNARYYVRVPGRRKIRLAAPPNSPAFWAEYKQARDNPPPPTAALASRRKGSMAWLAAQYRQSAEFKQLSQSTRYSRGKIIDRILRNIHRDATMADGDLPFAMMEKRHVVERRDDLADRPESANGVVRTLRRIFAWAIEAGHAAENPASGVTLLRPRNPEGFHAWTMAEVQQYMDRHPLGARARLALAILLYTGVRRSDAVRLGRQMECVYDGVPCLEWTEFKGRQRQRKLTTIPILPALREAIDACPSGSMIYLPTARGTPYTPESFGNLFRTWCDQAGLKQCSAHGLRKAGATMAANNGASEHTLMAIFGWTTTKQASVYTRTADRKRLARQGMNLISLENTAPTKVSHPKKGGTISSRKSLK